MDVEYLGMRWGSTGCCWRAARRHCTFGVYGDGDVHRRVLNAEAEYAGVSYITPS
jgi:hypothetical protein